jgi:hypothetical protein
MSDLEDRANRLLSLAIKYFERAERAESAVLAVQFRAMGSQYRDTAVLMLEGGHQRESSRPVVSMRSFRGPQVDRRVALGGRGTDNETHRSR